MEGEEFKKIEHWLYVYKKLENRIAIREQDLINFVNSGRNAFLKSRRTSSNSIEDIAIRLAEDKKINEMKIIKKEIKNGLISIKTKNIKIYNFIIYKYIKRVSSLEISEKLGYSKNKQDCITNKVVQFFYVRFKRKGVI